MAPLPPDGGQKEVHLTGKGSGRSFSDTTGTIEYNYNHGGSRTPVSFTRYGPVVVTDHAIGVLHRFLGRLSVAPKDGLNPTINGVRLELRRWI